MEKAESSGGSMVCLNGQMLPESEARVPVSDRGFLYGDAVFETMRVYGGVPFAWERHLERMQRGCQMAGWQLPDPAQWKTCAQQLIVTNRVREGVLRIQLSRGSGARGYDPAGAGPSRWVITTHPAPSVAPDHPRRVRLATVSWRVPSDPRWAVCKSVSRLVQVLATREAVEKRADEPLLLNERGQVVEAGAANFFWIHGGVARTPSVESGALAGITRGWILEIAPALGIPAEIGDLRAADLAVVESAFLTSSVWEVQRVAAIDGRPLTMPEVVRELHRAYRERVERYCASERPVADGSHA